MEAPSARVHLVAREHGRIPRGAEAEQVQSESPALPAPETDVRVYRLGEVHDGSVVVALERPPPLPAPGLIDTPVHVEVYVTARLHLALDERVRVEHVDEVGVRGVQLVPLVHRDEQRHGRVQARDPRHLVRAEGVGGERGHVRPQAEPDHVHVLRPLVPQPLHQLGQTIAHVGHVLHGDRVAGGRSQPMPVHGYHVVIVPLQVLVPHVHQIGQLHVRVVAVHHDLGGVRRIEIRPPQVRPAPVHEYLLPGFRIPLREQEERHFLVGARLIRVHQARAYEVIPALLQRVTDRQR